MSDVRLPRYIFLGILAAAAAQCIHDFPLLPQRVASHFAASGMPNGWMTKSLFLTIYGFTLLPVLVVEFLVPRLIANSPSARLNLPNKEYWLTPERRAATFAYFERFFAWYGCAFLALLVFVMGLAMGANLNPSPQLPAAPIFSALIAFALFNVAAILAMYRRFSMPE